MSQVRIRKSARVALWVLVAALFSIALSFWPGIWMRLAYKEVGSGQSHGLDFHTYENRFTGSRRVLFLDEQGEYLFGDGDRRVTGTTSIGRASNRPWRIEIQLESGETVSYWWEPKNRNQPITWINEP